MSLRRVDTTFDLPEAHIVVGLLRSEGIDAHVFDADFVRQDWFRAIAYGGYRILVADEDVPVAIERIRVYREAKPALSDAADAPCPLCSSCTYRDDPRPRRWVFALYILPSLIEVPIILFGHPSEVQQFFWFVIDFAVYVMLALLAIAYLKRRYVCDNCGHRWRDSHRHTYSALDDAHVAAFGPPG
jgi:hypothetical protein